MEFIDYRERLKDGPFDLIIADIPWAYHNPRPSETSKKRRHLVTYETIDDVHALMAQFYHALIQHRNLWIWTDWFNLPALLSAAQEVGFVYRGLCSMKRVSLGLGDLIRKQVYYLPVWSKGKPYHNPDAWLSEFLGEYRIARSRKPQAVYDKIIAHSLPPGGKWIDPFPATHDEEYPGPQGTTVIKPRLFSAEMGDIA